MARITKSQILCKVAKLAELTGIPYQSDYSPQYGGYNLFYKMSKGGGDCRGKYGFDYRKSPSEMDAYLNGVIAALCP